MNTGRNVRALILSACFISLSAYIAQASRVEPVPIRQSLGAFPEQFGAWRYGGEEKLSGSVVDLLGVTDYMARLYSTPNAHVGVYIAFYETQRQGRATIHSPMNCLPSAGWNPADRSTLAVGVKSSSGTARTIQVNRIVIEKGSRRQLVLYWYQSQGRVVASEYWGKVYTVLDAMKNNRTDAALVRIVTAISGSDEAAVQNAESAAVDFVQEMFPLLSDYLPE